MNIEEIDNKNKWENFLRQCEEKTFLDSWNWAEFQKKLDKEVWRPGIKSSSELKGVATVIKINARRGTFLFVPHGPVCKPNTNNKQELVKALLKELKKIAKEENASFLRVGPI